MLNDCELSVEGERATLITLFLYCIICILYWKVLSSRTVSNSPSLFAKRLKSQIFPYPACMLDMHEPGLGYFLSLEIPIREWGPIEVFKAVSTIPMSCTLNSKGENSKSGIGSTTNMFQTVQYATVLRIIMITKLKGKLWKKIFTIFSSSFKYICM